MTRYSHYDSILVEQVTERKYKMDIVYRVVDMPIKEFTTKIWGRKTKDDFDFQDKILFRTNNPYDLIDYDENLTVLVYADNDIDWFTVRDIVTDAKGYRDFLAIPFN